MNICCPQAATFSFQNNSKYWEDAQEFKPERFLAEPVMSERAYNMPAFCAFGDVSVFAQMSPSECSL